MKHQSRCSIKQQHIQRPQFDSLNCDPGSTITKPTTQDFTPSKHINTQQSFYEETTVDPNYCFKLFQFCRALTEKSQIVESFNKLQPKQRRLISTTGSATMIDPSVDTLQLLETQMSDSTTSIRKLSTYAMCLLMTSRNLPQEIRGPLCMYLNNFEQISFGVGKVILNKMPSTLVRQLNADKYLLNDIKGSEYLIDNRIWCFPQFNQVQESGEIGDVEDRSVSVKSMDAFETSFPDPLYYCIGVFHNSAILKGSQRKLEKRFVTLFERQKVSFNNMIENSHRFKSIKVPGKTLGQDDDTPLDDFADTAYVSFTDTELKFVTNKEKPIRKPLNTQSRGSPMSSAKKSPQKPSVARKVLTSTSIGYKPPTALITRRIIRTSVEERQSETQKTPKIPNKSHKKPQQSVKTKQKLNDSVISESKPKSITQYKHFLQMGTITKKTATTPSSSRNNSKINHNFTTTTPQKSISNSLVVNINLSCEKQQRGETSQSVDRKKQASQQKRKTRVTTTFIQL